MLRATLPRMGRARVQSRPGSPGSRVLSDMPCTIQKQQDGKRELMGEARSRNSPNQYQPTWCEILGQNILPLQQRGVEMLFLNGLHGLLALDSLKS